MELVVACGRRQKQGGAYSISTKKGGRLERDFGELFEEDQRVELAWERKLVGEERKTEESCAEDCQVKSP